MEIELFLDETLEKNAARYFDEAKKQKKKILGVQEILDKTQRQLATLQAKDKKAKEEAAKQVTPLKRKKHWFEKYHWFYTSKGNLCIGGRDATTNEILIKKHCEPGDLVFHTDMAGSPFFVLKGGEGIKSQAILEEVATAVSCYSRAWKLGHGRVDVFYVKPEQVSKTPQSGEYLSHGSFVIRGKTTYVEGEMRLAIGVSEGIILGGPKNAVVLYCPTYAMIIQGKEKPSDLAKKLSRQLHHADIDEIVRTLPAGGCKIEGQYTSASSQPLPLKSAQELSSSDQGAKA